MGVHGLDSQSVFQLIHGSSGHKKKTGARERDMRGERERPHPSRAPSRSPVLPFAHYLQDPATQATMGVSTISAELRITWQA